MIPKDVYRDHGELYEGHMRLFQGPCFRVYVGFTLIAEPKLMAQKQTCRGLEFRRFACRVQACVLKFKVVRFKLGGVAQYADAGLKQAMAGV